MCLKHIKTNQREQEGQPFVADPVQVDRDAAIRDADQPTTTLLSELFEEIARASLMQVSAAAEVTDRRWITTLRQQLQSAEIELTAELTHATVTLGQIQKMKVGDVIPVAIPDSIIAKVDGTPLMECRFGQQQGQLAIRVERFIAQDKQESTERENHV